MKTKELSNSELMAVAPTAAGAILSGGLPEGLLRKVRKASRDECPYLQGTKCSAGIGDRAGRCAYWSPEPGQQKCFYFEPQFIEGSKPELEYDLKLERSPLDQENSVRGLVKRIDRSSWPLSGGQLAKAQPETGPKGSFLGRHRAHLV